MDNIELWKKYKNDRTIYNRNIIVEKYAFLVKQVIHMMPSARVSYIDEEDLYSEGAIGLIDAVEKFDIEKKVKFKTYAYLRIRGAVIDYLRKTDILSRSVRKQYKEILEFTNNFKQKKNREPSTYEIAIAISLPEKKVKRILEEATLSSMVSFETFIEDNGDVVKSSHADESPEKALEIAQLKEALASQIEKLSDKEKTIITLYYYEELTFKEIAKVLSLSESRISQILSKLLHNLKENMQKNI